ncbi:hypothetical protein F7725_019305 [Dissostichus mawsoni]|uniref:Uncharacterized protein n=1 Tax=Dissostichus mawsoni TaxID=36200 RepID=A0A7J5YJB2_DISMA|nr:hypothetical protein F7725_019305 [Dissostichus mawsoni]
MKQQREAEERRAQESRENLNRLFSLLEKLVVLLDLATTIKTLVSSDGTSSRADTSADSWSRQGAPLNTFSPSSSATSSTMSSSGAMMSPAPMQMLWRTAHAVMI